MKTATFCHEVAAGVTPEQIDARVNQMKTLGGAVDAYAKTVGEKRYICAIREVFDESFADGATHPERVAADGAASPSMQAGGATGVTTSAVSGLLGEDDYRRAAATLDCEAAAIRAVADVESGGKTGFLSDGRPKILFESHVFSKLTGQKYDVAHPDISTPTWVRNYVGGSGEYDRLSRAMLLDREAALKAASWGKFQILGMNYARAGFDTVDQFVEAQKQSERRHLDAFVNFILSHDLSDELRERRWADFARRYNGSRFAENRYDEKMASAYSMHSVA